MALAEVAVAGGETQVVDLFRAQTHRLPALHERALAVHVQDGLVLVLFHAVNADGGRCAHAVRRFQEVSHCADIALLAALKELVFRLELAVCEQRLLAVLVKELAGHDLIEKAQIARAVHHRALDHLADLRVGIGVFLVESDFLLCHGSSSSLRPRPFSPAVLS